MYLEKKMKICLINKIEKQLGMQLFISHQIFPKIETIQMACMKTNYNTRYLHYILESLYCLHIIDEVGKQRLYHSILSLLICSACSIGPCELLCRTAVTLVPTKPFLFLPVRPLPSQLSFNALANPSIFA